jgi:hypothetical protein
MTRLQKFVERGPYGEGAGRIAYVLDVRWLPPSTQGMDWIKIDSFNAAHELWNDPNLKAVFKVAIDKGWAIVAAQAKAK